MSYIVHNLEAPAVLEAKSLSLCWEAYARFSARKDIDVIGFSDQTEYVYIALANGITIASKFGQEVIYIVFDHDSNTETYHDRYIDAEIYA